MPFDFSRKQMRKITGLLMAGAISFSPFAGAEEPPPPASPVPSPEGDLDKPEIRLNPNLKVKTLGGRQFWADVEYFHKLRIQQNVFTGHFRLLDEDDSRLAWGTREQCREKLCTIRRERKLTTMSGEAVILIHGMIRSSKSMGRLSKPFEEAGYTTFSLDYPSTRIDIAEASENLHSVVESLEGIERIHFVVHSMGGLVVRSYLSQHKDPRIGRLVMIATPNLGADLASRLKSNVVYKVVFGPAGQQLARDPDGFIAKLPTPSCEFAVIAGGRGNDDGYNPLIPGDDDGTVSIECTRLPGATDFAVIDRIHTLLLVDPKTVEYSVRFIQQGRFRKEGDSQPIPKIIGDDNAE